MPQPGKDGLKEETAEPGEIENQLRTQWLSEHAAWQQKNEYCFGEEWFQEEYGAGTVYGREWLCQKN